MTGIAKELILLWAVGSVFFIMTDFMAATYDWPWHRTISCYDFGCGLIMAYWATGIRKLAKKAER